MRFFHFSWQAFANLFNDGGFSIAGAVAFSAVLAIFPFFIFVSAVAGFLGGPELAAIATEQTLQLLPVEVARYLVPQIEAVLGQERYDLLTVGGLVTLFFASNGIESLRWALNTSYEDDDQRSFLWLRGQSIALVIVTALVLLFLAYTVLVAPMIAAGFGAKLSLLLPGAFLSEWLRNGFGLMVLVALLYVFHAWLPGRRRRFGDLWPGIVLTIMLWAISAYGYGFYLGYSQYSAIYAGLSQIIIALIFFYISAAILIFGAEYNHVRMARRPIPQGTEPPEAA